MSLVEISGELVTVEVARALIMRAQAKCFAAPDEIRMKESPPVKHWFAPGIYCRQINLQAGSTVIGRIHRHEHMNIISAGDVTVFTEFGIQELKAGDSFTSKPGTKRVVAVHQDTIWTTIHPNPDNCTDVHQLEERYTAAEYSELGMTVADLELLT
jgi:hypothetical protein